MVNTLIEDVMAADGSLEQRLALAFQKRFTKEGDPGTRMTCKFRPAAEMHTKATEGEKWVTFKYWKGTKMLWSYGELWGDEGSTSFAGTPGYLERLERRMIRIVGIF